MIDFGFNEKFAIITGGNRGIGKAIAETLLRYNAEVLITSTGNKPTWCYKYTKSHHEILDFTAPGSLKAFLSKLASYDRIDILVNNAGIHIPQPVDQIEDEDWVRVIKINLFGPMALIRGVVSRMKLAHRGWIINIGSIAGITSNPGSNAYSASKSGLIGLTRASALDLAPFNILINTLCPGITQTDMVDTILTSTQKDVFKKSIPMRRFANVQEIANMAVFLCSAKNTYITGQAIIVDGGKTIQ